MKIVFEFVGGNKDGCRVVGNTNHPPRFSEAEKEAFEASSFYHMTKEGTVGAAFRGITEYGVNLMQTIGAKAAMQQGHKFRAEMYVVTDRIETEDQILVRARFVPESVESS